jgi:hypothetical protein
MVLSPPAVKFVTHSANHFDRYIPIQIQSCPLSVRMPLALISFPCGCRRQCRGGNPGLDGVAGEDER